MGRTRSALAACWTAFSLLAATVALAAEPKATVEGTLDRALRQQIERAIGEAKSKPEGRFEARRRARQAAADAAALLRSEGYYSPTIEAKVSESDPPRALVEIQPGPRFQISQPSIDWSAPIPGAKAEAAAFVSLGLAAGAPGRAADILAAEGRAVAAVQKLGYPDARALPRRVVVDDTDHTVRPRFRIEAGPLVRLGAIKVVSHGRTDPHWLQGLATWRQGDIYDPAKVAKLERVLTDTGVFQSITVSLAPADQLAAGLRPVLVSVSDRKPNTIELSGGYDSASEAAIVGAFPSYTDLSGAGSGVQAKWLTYDRLHRADTITLTAQLYDIQQKLDLELDLPGWLRPDQILKVGGGFTADNTPAYDDDDTGVRLAVERHFTKTTYVSLGGALDYTGTTEETAINPDATPVGERLNLFIVTAIAGFSLDRSDNYLNPTKGWKFDIRLEPTDITGDRRLDYLKAEAQASTYLSLDSTGSTVLAARARFGSILGGEIPDVPGDRRFYAGGGGSVRGYGFQEVGPRLEDNTPEGGLSLFESSFEVRQRLTNSWGVVAFVDAGSVGESEAPVFTGLSTGVGLGVRYNLGFAPFRVDIATPLNPRLGDARVQVYVSIGQSF